MSTKKPNDKVLIDQLAILFVIGSMLFIFIF